MNLLKSLAIALSMYSKIPMPRVDWDDKSMKYALCFFPFVGIIEGAVYYALWSILSEFGIESLIKGAILCVFPIIFTGGIHMDGYLDTCDARGSHKTSQEKLLILKDSHVGAYAILGALIWLVLSFAASASIYNEKQVRLIALAFIISRAYSGLSLVSFKNARNKGLAYTWTQASGINITRVVLLLTIIATFILILRTDFGVGIVVCAASFLTFLYYRIMSYEEFGGITGDLAGFYLVLCELTVLLVVTIAG